MVSSNFISKISFTPEENKLLKTNDLVIKLNGGNMRYIIPECEIINLMKGDEKTRLILKITSRGFIKKCEDFERFLILQSSINSLSWFGDEYNTDETCDMLKPIFRNYKEHEHCLFFTLNNNEVQNSKDGLLYKDWLLYKKKIIDVVVSFDKIIFKPFKFYCDITIKQFIYLGQWSLNIHNKTYDRFQEHVMLLLLCNNCMYNKLNNDIFIKILEFFQTS
jgi:hypothetical protein